MKRFQRIEEAEKTMKNDLQPYSWYDHLKIFQAGGSLAKVSCHSIHGHPVLVICFLEGGYYPRILTAVMTEKQLFGTLCKKPDQSRQTIS
jgi:hypothetical protein